MYNNTENNNWYILLFLIRLVNQIAYTYTDSLSLAKLNESTGVPNLPRESHVNFLHAHVWYVGAVFYFFF